MKKRNVYAAQFFDKNTFIKNLKKYCYFLINLKYNSIITSLLI